MPWLDCSLIGSTDTDYAGDPLAVAADDGDAEGDEERERQHAGLVIAQGPRRGQRQDRADALARALKSAGAKAAIRVVPVGPDLDRGWGKRRSVARDYLYDDPVMLGSLRVGPDLANAGARLPDPNWHLRHLYAPRSQVKDSLMPPYRYLFERRRIGWQPSPDALQFPKELAPPPGFEIVPKPEARLLVAYLLSLRAETPLFEAPLTIPSTHAK